MGTLYNRDGSIIAYYENGVVYDDATKCRTLGTYDNNGIYETSFIGTGNMVGYVEDDIIMSGYGGILSRGIGRVSGRCIYLGTNSYNTHHIAYFMGDELGAAAAALLSGILTSDQQTNIDYSNNVTTYESYAPSGGRTFKQEAKEGISSLFSIVLVVMLLFSLIVDIFLIYNIVNADPVGNKIGLFALIGFVGFAVAFIVSDSKGPISRYICSMLIGVAIPVFIHYLYFNGVDPKQTDGGFITLLLTVFFNFSAIFLPSFITSIIVLLKEDKK